MRLFFALEPEPRDALAIADWRDRQLNCAGRPVPVANFHITLAFLGEIRDPALPQLVDGVDRRFDEASGARHALRLTEVGYWPKPGILWLGPGSWPDSLALLARELRELAVTLGAKRERRRFQPHVTLYRRVAEAPPAPAAPPDIAFTCDGFHLMESRQGKTGVSYHSLCQWRSPPGRGY